MTFPIVTGSSITREVLMHDEVLAFECKCNANIYCNIHLESVNKP